MQFWCYQQVSDCWSVVSRQWHSHPAESPGRWIGEWCLSLYMFFVTTSQAELHIFKLHFFFANLHQKNWKMITKALSFNIAYVGDSNCHISLDKKRAYMEMQSLFRLQSIFHIIERTQNSVALCGPGLRTGSNWLFNWKRAVAPWIGSLSP